MTVNRRLPEPRVHFNTQNLRSYSLWLKNILTIPNQNVDLQKRNSSHLHGLQRIWTKIFGAIKPVIIMTDSKSVTRFFQTKMIRPPLWNAYDFVVQFNFIIAHIPGKMNTAADFSYRLEMDPNEKIFLKIREDIATKPIEVNIEFTGIAQEEPVFLVTTDQLETTEKKRWKRKEEA